MRNILFLSLLLLMSSSMQAQHYVDIMVNDTFAIKATGIVYSVMVDSNYGYEAEEDYGDYKEIQQKQRQRIRQKEQELVLFFQSKKIDYTLALPSAYMISPYIYQFSNQYLIKVNTEEELQKLCDQLRMLDYVTGNIKDMDYDFTNLSDEKMFEQLYKKAAAKAAAMAKIMNRTVGQVIQAEEMNKNDNNSSLAEVLNSMNRPDSYYDEERSVNMTFRLEKFMRFRFELL